MLNERDHRRRPEASTELFVVSNESETIQELVNAEKEKEKVDMNFRIELHQFTMVAALKAEPKSIPITSPDKVSIRKLKMFKIILFFFR